MPTAVLEHAPLELVIPHEVSIAESIVKIAVDCSEVVIISDKGARSSSRLTTIRVGPIPLVCGTLGCVLPLVS